MEGEGAEEGDGDDEGSGGLVEWCRRRRGRERGRGRRGGMVAEGGGEVVRW